MQAEKYKVAKSLWGSRCFDRIEPKTVLQIQLIKG